MKNRKLVIVGPDNSTGYRKHLENISYLFENSKYIKIKKKDSSEINYIIKEKPSLTIFGGRRWIIRNKKILNKIPGKKGVLYCSPLAQAEISGDEIKNLTEYLNWLQKGQIDYLYVSSLNLCKALNNPKVVHLPAPAIFNQKKGLKKNSVSVCILSDKALHKNILNAFSSAFLSDAKQIITNGLIQDYKILLDNMPESKKLIDKGFMNSKEYNNSLKKSKLLIHISFSESFCYTILEALEHGTLVLTTNVVDWLGIKELTIEKNCEINHIMKKINYILSLNEREYELLLNKALNKAEKICKKNNKVVYGALIKLLD